MQGLTPRRLV